MNLEPSRNWSDLWSWGSLFIVFLVVCGIAVESATGDSGFGWLTFMAGLALGAKAFSSRRSHRMHNGLNSSCRVLTPEAFGQTARLVFSPTADMEADSADTFRGYLKDQRMQQRAGVVQS